MHSPSSEAQTKPLKIAAFDWDDTLSPDSQTLYPWVKAMMEVLRNRKIHIVIVTNKSKTEDIKKALPFIEEKDIYNPVKANEAIGKRPEFEKNEIHKADIIQHMVLKDYNDAHPQEPAQLSDVAFTDDSETNIHHARERGVTVLPFKQIMLQNGSRQPEKDLPVKYLTAVLRPAQLLEKAKKLSTEITQTRSTYDLARSAAMEAHSLYSTIGDKAGIIMSLITLANIYAKQHAINFSLGANAEQKDYRVRRIHAADDILQVLKSAETPNVLFTEESKPAVKAALIEFFDNINDQMNTYIKNKQTPQELQDVLNQKKCTLQELKDSFDFKLDDTLKVVYPEKSNCLVM